VELLLVGADLQVELALLLLKRLPQSFVSAARLAELLLQLDVLLEERPVRALHFDELLLDLPLL